MASSSGSASFYSRGQFKAICNICLQQPDFYCSCNWIRLFGTFGEKSPGFNSKKFLPPCICMINYHFASFLGSNPMQILLRFFPFYNLSKFCHQTEWLIMWWVIHKYSKLNEYQWISCNTRPSFHEKRSSAAGTRQVSGCDAERLLSCSGNTPARLRCLIRISQDFYLFIFVGNRISDSAAHGNRFSTNPCLAFVDPAARGVCRSDELVLKHCSTYFVCVCDIKTRLFSICQARLRFS